MASAADWHSVTRARLTDSYLQVRAALNRRAHDPLSWWRFAVPRLRDAFALFSSANPIDELHARACNKGTKTESCAAFVVACLQKRRCLDGVKLPEWRGPVHALALSLDYPQQKLSDRKSVV